VFLTFLKFSLVYGAINAFSIPYPCWRLSSHSPVSEATSTSEDPFPVELIIFQVSFIDVSVRIDESSSSIGLVILPESLIESITLKDLFTPAVAHTVVKLAYVTNAFFHLYGSFSDEGRQLLFAVLEGPNALVSSSEHCRVILFIVYVFA
jgi:hypothetical protein